MSRFTLCVLAMLGVWGCYREQRPVRATLTAVADDLLEGMESEGASASALVVDARTGRVLYAHREHMRLLPASTMKVVSTAAVLAALGSEQRFHTPVVLEGALHGEIFEGALVVESSGDPSLGSWRFEETASACEQVAEALWARGVRGWRGEVRVRGPQPRVEDALGPGWAWDDLAYAYGAAPTPFVFRENVVELWMKRAEGASCAEPPRLRLEPELPGPGVGVEVDTGEGRPGLRCVREPGRGQLRCVWRPAPEAADCPRVSMRRVAVGEPEALFARCVEQALERRGVVRLKEVAKGEQAQAVPVSGVLVELVSPPLAELVKVTNKESLNLYAERLALRLARERLGRESYPALREALLADLARRGVAPRDLVPADGSGMSRYNLATARGLVGVLRSSLQEPYAQVLVDSLPIAGVDGTLASRPLSEQARGRVRAKTGTLAGQKAFVGVVERPQDKQYPRVVFALMLGNLSQPRVSELEVFDRLAEALVALPVR